jgi:hypothetical protein
MVISRLLGVQTISSEQESVHRLNHSKTCYLLYYEYNLVYEVRDIERSGFAN